MDISVSDVVGDLGGFARVVLTMESDVFVMPTQYVEILSEQSGRIATWQEEQLVWVPVELGVIRGDFIEILTPIAEDMQIVFTNLSNFDPNAQFLTPKL